MVFPANQQKVVFLTDDLAGISKTYITTTYKKPEQLMKLTYAKLNRMKLKPDS